MTAPKELCPLHDVQFGHLREDLAELKARVQRLEATLARGVLLLVANLVGMVLSLAQQWTCR